MEIDRPVLSADPQPPVKPAAARQRKNRRNETSSVETASTPTTHAPEPSSKKALIIASSVMGLLLVVAGIAYLGYFFLVRPRLVFDPQIHGESYTRDALTDEVPVVNYQKYLTDELRQAYYKKGDGLELRFRITNDPRKGYQDWEPLPCGIPKAEKFRFGRKARETAVNELPATIQQCVAAFTAPIPRTEPISIGRDVTEGSDAVNPTVDKMFREQKFESRLVSATVTYEIQAFLIFDGPWLVGNTWQIPAGSNPAQVKAIVEEVRSWLLQPQEPQKNSSIGFGILNGLAMRTAENLRQGEVFIISDGVEFSSDPTSPGAIDFYIGRDGGSPAYLGTPQWSRFTKKILADNGGACTKLFGAKVHWYPPPVKDLVVRRAAKYWEHFLTTQCGAGSFTFHP
ncbi:MAG: hypothetical protein M3M85_02695 [bacterium]|nr:hypothetical protein [bacterium]